MNALDRKLVSMGLMEAKPGWFDVFIIRLRAYKVEKGHCGVPQKYKCSDGYPLGMKVRDIRHGANRTTDEQREILDAEGFVWSGPEWVCWPTFIEHLRAFKAENGHCRVPKDYVCPDGHGLGRITQHIRRTSYRLSTERRAALDAEGFWTKNIDTWLENTPSWIWERVRLIDPKAIQVAELTRKGHSQEEIGRLLQISQPTISYTLQRTEKRIQFVLREPDITRLENVLATIALSNEDKQMLRVFWETTSQSRVAEAVGRTQGCVRYRLNLSLQVMAGIPGEDAALCHAHFKYISDQALNILNLMAHA